MKVILAGDYCPHGRMLRDDRFLDTIAPVIKRNDFAIVNLECAICPPDSQPIQKVGPNLRAEARFLDILQSAGFNVLTLANNHFADYGQEGLHSSLAEISRSGFYHVGAGKNLNEASWVLYLKDDTCTVALINACESEFTIADTDHGGCNPYNPISLHYAIAEARKHADYVFVIIHGGAEDINLPSLRMQQEYRFLIDSGADLVVNHHQHCFLGFEQYKGGYIYYGLGNFCFDWRTEKNADAAPTPWNYGYLVEVKIDTTGLHPTVVPYEQCAREVAVTPLTGEQLARFKSEFSTLSNTLLDTQALREAYEREVAAHCRDIDRLLLPARLERYVPRRMAAWWLRHDNHRLRKLLNAVRCESHRDRLLTYLNTLR